MPNELKNSLNASTSHTDTRKLSKAGSSSITAMIWTISGMVLAACGGTQFITRPTEGEGTTVVVPGASSGGPVVRVVDGPVKGAAVYFDLNGDGNISQEERDAQTDETGRPLYVTDENGEVQIPGEYEGVRFVAVVENAIDTATGDTLTGEYSSLDNGIIASPLTNLLDSVEKDGGSVQETLNEIFGTNQDSALEITLADVLNHENYQVLDTPNVPVVPAEPQEVTLDETDPGYEAAIASYEAALEAYQQAVLNVKTYMITRAAIALTEIDQDDSLLGAGVVDTVNQRVDSLRTLFDEDTTNDISDLVDRINAREVDGRAVNDGKPVAAPDPYIFIDEDTSFSIADYKPDVDDSRGNLETLFGFVDPGQNAPDEVISAFRGIYISTDITNGSILFDGGTLSSHQTATGDGVPSGLPSESGFYYISFGRLSLLTIKPDADYFGELNVDYYVFDGIDFSAKASLIVNVRSVNDDPTFAGLSGDRDNSAATQYVLSTEGQIILADGTVSGMIVNPTDTEDTLDAASFRLSGADAALFEVVAVQGGGFRLQLNDASNAKIAGDTYDVTITVVDSDGGESAPQSFTLTQGGFYLGDSGGTRTYSNGDALINEEADGSTSAITLGKIGVEGLDTDASGTSGELGYRSAITFSTNTDGFAVNGENLDFTGADSGDFETGDTLSVSVIAEGYEIVAQVEDFTGQKDASVSPFQQEGGPDDFSYSGGLVTLDTDTPADIADDGTPFALLDISAGVIYLKARDADTPARSISFDAVDNLRITGQGIIVVNDDGEISFIDGSESFTSVVYPLAVVSAPTTRDVDVEITPAVNGLADNGFIALETASGDAVTVNFVFADISTSDVATTVLEAGQTVTITVGGEMASGVYHDYSAILLVLQTAITDGTITILESATLVSGASGAVVPPSDSTDSITVPAATPAVTESITIAVAPDTLTQNVGTEVTTPEALLTKEYTQRTFDYTINLENIDDNAPVFSSPDVAVEAATLGLTASIDAVAAVRDAVTNVVDATGLIFTSTHGAEVTVKFVVIDDTTRTDVDPDVDQSLDDNEITVTLHVDAPDTFTSEQIRILLQSEIDTYGFAGDTFLLSAIGLEGTGPYGSVVAQTVGEEAIFTIPAAPITQEATPEVDAAPVTDGAEAAITFTAKAAGVVGNDIQIAFVIDNAQAGDGVFNVATVGNLITITLNEDGATLSDIKAAFATNTLVDVTVADGQDSLVISDAIEATALSGGVSETVSIDEDVADTAVLYTVASADADGDDITYTLDAASQALFAINADGEITLISGMNLDFETAETHDIVVTATSTFPGEAAKTTDVQIRINVQDVNEEPDSLGFTDLVAITSSDLAAAIAGVTELKVATITSSDPDAGDIVTLSVTGGVHSALFAIGSDGASLVFTGTEDDFLNPGEQYDVVVTATDTGGLSIEESPAIIQGGVFITTSDGTQVYTNDPDNPLLPEELVVGTHDDGNMIPINGVNTDTYLIGTLGDFSGTTAFAVATGSETDFYIDSNNMLYFIGDDSGDFESGEVLTVTIEAVAPSALSYEFVITLGNVDDAAPIFDSVDALGDVVVAGDAITPILEVAEGSALELATILGSDADGDDVTYRLQAGVLDNDLFEINAQGELRFKAGQNDFEHNDAASGVFEITVTLASTSLLEDATGQPRGEQTLERTLEIHLADVNEAPTAVTISRAALVAGDNIVGIVNGVDEDADDDAATLTYELRDAGGTDNALFGFAADNPQQLIFIGTDGSGADIPGENGRKALGETYTVEVTVSDGEYEYTQELFIAEGSVFLEIDHDSDGSTADVKRYSSFVDGDGNGLLDENADGSTTPVVLGKLGAEQPGAVLSLASKNDGNNNDEFVLTANGQLAYTGSASGDFESGDFKTVEVAIVTTVEKTVEVGEFVYSSTIDNPRASSADDTSHYFMTDVDLTSARHGAVGEAALTVTLLRGDGNNIVITGNIPGLPSTATSAGLSHAIYAVRNGDTWSFGRIESDANQEPAGDEVIFLYNIDDATGGASQSYSGVTTLGEGQTYHLDVDASTEVFNIRLADVNDAPVLTVSLVDDNGDSIVTVEEGGEITLTTDMLQVSDADAADNVDVGGVSQANGDEMIFTVTGAIKGKVQRDGTDVTTFSLAELRDGRITFLHDGSEQYVIGSEGYATETPDPSLIILTVSDGDADSAARLLTFEVTPVEDAPASNINTGATLDEGTTHDFDGSELKFTDVDSPAGSVLYELTEVPEHGGLVLTIGGLKSITDMEVGDRFSQFAISEGSSLQYEHDGSENFADSFKFKVLSIADNGEEVYAENGREYTFDLTITSTNDAPIQQISDLTTRQSGFDKDYIAKGGEEANPFGDNVVERSNIAEGGTYILTALDMGVFDSDDNDDDVTFTLTELPQADGMSELTVQFQGTAGDTNSWADVSAGDTLTLEALKAGRLRVVHNGKEPSETPFELKYTFADDESADSAEVTVTIEPRPVNDAPTVISFSAARIDPELSGNNIGEFSTEDEETTDQADFTYELTTPDEGDSRYFEIVDRQLQFKANLPDGLQRKVDGESYTFDVKVTDLATDGTTDPAKEAQSLTQTITLPVRFFDIDWDHTTTGVIDQAPTLEYDLKTDTGVLTIGEFIILPSNPHSNDQYSVQLRHLGNDFIDSVSVQAGVKTDGANGGGRFVIRITPNADNPVLKELSADDTLQVSFTMLVRYRSESADDVVSWSQSTETFNVLFRGKNEAPEVLPQNVVSEGAERAGDDQIDNADGARAKGQWQFADPDNGDVIQTQGLLASHGAGSTPTAVNLLVDPDAGNYDETAEMAVRGTYGSLWVKADGTWEYRADDRIENAPITGGSEIFRLQVVDTNGGASGILEITIMVMGENDAPELGLNIDTIDATLEDITDQTATVSESSDSHTREEWLGSNPDHTTAAAADAEYDRSDTHLTFNASAQRTSGRWAADDVDENSELRFFVNSVNIGTVTTNRSFEGLFGQLQLNADGSWLYTTRARSEEIAEGETPVDRFVLTVRDQYDAVSNEIVLSITVTGENDAPVDIIGNVGTVEESAFRVDARLDFLITVNNQDSIADPTRALAEADPATLNPLPLLRSDRASDVSTERTADADGNDFAGTPSVTGQLDVLDVDVIDSQGRRTAADLHTFVIVDSENSDTAQGLSDIDSQAAINPRDFDTSNTDPTTSLKGIYGTLTLNQFSGEWRYDLDNTDDDTIALKEGVSVTDDFWVRVTDEENEAIWRKVVITVTGKDDAGILTHSQSIDVEVTEAGGTGNVENTGTPATGTLLAAIDDDGITDGSGGNTLSYRAGTSGSWEETSTASGVYGDLSVTNLVWTYTLRDGDGNVQALDEGDTVTETLQFQYRDSSLGDAISNIITVVVTITGTNDAPVISSSDATASINEDDTTTRTGVVSFNDVDDDDTSATMRIKVGVTSSSSSTDPALSSALVSTTVDGVAPSSILGEYGVFSFTRNDANGQLTWTYRLADTDGDLQTDVTDAMRTRVQALFHGEVVKERLTVVVNDGDLDSNIYSVIVSITGTNDQPVLGDVTGATVNDVNTSNADSTFTGSLTGTFSESDIDSGDTHTFKAVLGGNGAVADISESGYTHRVDGTYGDLYYNVNTGAYVYLRDEAAINALDNGENRNDTFAISTIDNRGQSNSESDTKNLVFSIVGTNDAATITGGGTATINEDESGSTSNVIFSFADVDTSDVLANLIVRAFASGEPSEPTTPAYTSGSHTDLASGSQTIASTYGTFTLNRDDSNGQVTVTYDLDETNSVVTALNSGSSLIEKLTLYVDDRSTTTSVGDPQTYVVTIEGQNDAPTITLSTAAGTVDENSAGAAIPDIRFTPADVDSGTTFDASDFTIEGRDGLSNNDANNLFEVVSVGSGEYGIKLKSGQMLDAEAVSSYKISVSVSDGTASSTFTSDITINVNDLNDVAPTIDSSATGTALEENAAVSASTAVYTATGTHDVTSIVWSLKAGTGDIALFDIDSTTGEVTFKVATTPDYETKSSYTFTVVATSGSLPPVEQVVTIAVTDVNDVAPTIDSSATGTALDENTEVSDDTVVYTAAGTFDVTSIVWSLKAGTGDVALFDIDSTTGEVTFKAATTPDYETKSSYTFTVVATSGSLPPVEKVVTIAVTDSIDEGDAVYIIDDVNTGAVEHITDASSLDVGSTLYARLLSDDPEGNGIASYQWKRGGVDIASATSAAYTLTAADLGRILTVTVSYTDGRSIAESVTTDDVTIPVGSVDPNQASFTLISDGDIDVPLVGDELTVIVDTADPQGDGAFSYQWFDANGPDIAGATEASYTITETNQIIGVRVTYTDGGSNAEIVSTVLSTASVDPIVDRSLYTLVKTGDGSGEDTLTGTSGVADLILGGNRDDDIDTNGGDDVVIGGYGRDTITLSDDGAETVVYRFSSDVVTEGSQTGWIAIDGADTINNFERGVDKLVFVDVDGTPLDLAGFLAGSSSINISPNFEGTDLDVLTGITFQFIGNGLPDGPGNGGTHSGRWFRVIFKNPITVYDNYDSASATSPTTEEGTALLGENGASHSSADRVVDRYLTDLTLLPNYFQAADEDFDDGLRVIELSELGVDNAPVITSGTTGTARDEGTQISDSTVVYTATGTFDLTPIVWSLRGDDASLFDISSNGAVTFKAATTPDYETKSSYSFTVVATSASRESTQQVTFNINNVNDNSPSISQSGTQNTLNEGTFNSATNTGYSYTATDADGGSAVLTVTGDTRFEIVSGNLRIKAGSVFDYETSTDRSITLTINAADSGTGSGVAPGAGTRQVTITIGNVNDNDPVITSSAAGASRDEGVQISTSTVVYDADGTFDLTSITWSLRDDDANLFDIDSSTGEVTFKVATTPDHEDKIRYRFTVVAASGAREVTQAVTINVNDLNDEAPVITSGGTATALVENTEVEITTAVYTAVGTFDVTSITWSLRDDDANLFDISSNGEVTFKAATTPDYETKTSYSFTVVATSGGLSSEQGVTIAVTDDVSDNTPPLFALPVTLVPTAGTGTGGADTLTGTTAAELIQGGNDNDVITTGGGDDVVIGGYGRDTITLSNDGAETVVYRFESDQAANGDWQALDGGDTINNFRLGVDTLILVDVSGDSNPINDLAEFIADGGKPAIGITFDVVDSNIDQISLAFSLSGSANGPAGGAASGNRLTINFDATALLDSSGIPDGAFNGAFDTLTDLSHLAAIFGGVDYLKVVTDDDLPSGLTIL